MPELERVYGENVIVSSEKIPPNYRTFVQELVDYVEYHPCASTIENLVKGVVEARVKGGEDAASAKKVVESAPLKEFLRPNNVDLIRKRLSHDVERLRRNGYPDWAEKEAWALFRIDQPEAEARRKLSQLKK